MIAMINQVGELWLEYFGLAVIQNTIFLGLVFLALVVLKNASARLKYLVALIGLIKLLLLPFWNVSVLAELFQRSSPGSILFIDGALIQVGSIPLNSSVGLSGSGLLFLVWGVVGSISILFPVLNTIKLQRNLQKSELVPMANFNGNLNRDSVELHQTEKTNLPLTFGIFKHKIIVPVIWQTWSRDCQHAVLAHEIAHVRRRDSLVQFLQLVCQALYFFHPLVWLLNVKLHEYREMACDDEAIRTANISAIEYSKYLTCIANKVVYSGLGCTSISALIKRRNKLLNRVKYQLQTSPLIKISRTRIFVIFVFLLALILPLSWYCSNESPAEMVKNSMTADLIQLETTNIAPATEPADDKFLAYDTAPVPVGGFAEIQKNLEYPEIAMKAGIEGRVIVQADIDEQGQVVRTKLIKSLGDNGCDEAAIAAIKSVSWQPALQGDRPVKVRISIPVVFSLNRSHQPDQSTPMTKPADAPARIASIEKQNSELVPYDEPPVPVAGFSTITKNLHYPEIARKAGIEGKVVLQVQIDENGKVTKPEVIKSLGPDNGLDEAAIEAVTSVQWKPAIYQNRPVKTTMTIPIVFQLR